MYAESIGLRYIRIIYIRMYEAALYQYMSHLCLCYSISLAEFCLLF